MTAAKLPIYVAGASAEWERVRDIADHLEAHLHVTAYRWWDLGPLGMDGELSSTEAGPIAASLADAVRSAKAVVLVLPRLPTRGAWFELGLAYGVQLARRPVVYADGDPRQSVFEELLVRVDTLEQLCRLLWKCGARKREDGEL